jgi:Tol biopolymer transport system component
MSLPRLMVRLALSIMAFVAALVGLALTIRLVLPSGIIAFTSDRDGDQDVYLMDIGGSATVKVTNNNVMDVSLGWSLDGTHILFLSDRDGYEAVYFMTALGKHPQPFAGDMGIQQQPPAMSPEGNLILFVADDDGNPEIYVWGPDGSNRRRLTDNPAADWSPSWSQDGLQIVFASDRDGDNEIYIMNADGSDVRRLTYSPGQDMFPVWRP